MLLQEGDVIDLGLDNCNYADVPEHFVYRNRQGSWRRTHAAVIIRGEFQYLAGRYIVTKTTVDGGGVGHGPGDVYPNGHHVFCMRADDPSTTVDFYQTGCFTAMIPDLLPRGRAIQTWQIKAERHS